jgi:hypothetical protein
MTLHLVAMLINGTEVVSTTMDVEDDTIALVVGSDSIIVVLTHLNPFTLKGNLGSSPLPPFLTSNSL